MKQRTRTIAKAAVGAVALAASVWVSAPCTEGPAGSSKPQMTQVAQPQAPSAQVRQPSVSEDRARSAEEGPIKYKKVSRVVREGDPFIEIEFLFEQNGFFGFGKVLKIDEKGVELLIGETAPLRLNYGERMRIGEYALVSTIKVERGSTPGTAVLEITYPEAGEESATTVAPTRPPAQPSTQTEKGDGLRGSVLPATNLIAVREGRSTVREGDTIVRIEFVFEAAGFFEVKVAKIDARGIELGMEMEIFMSEHASNRAAPWRIDYGEERSFGPLFRPKVKAERGAEPGTAVIEVTWPGAASVEE